MKFIILTLVIGLACTASFADPIIEAPSPCKLLSKEDLVKLGIENVKAEETTFTSDVPGQTVGKRCSFKKRVGGHNSFVQFSLAFELEIVPDPNAKKTVRAFAEAADKLDRETPTDKKESIKVVTTENEGCISQYRFLGAAASCVGATEKFFIHALANDISAAGAKDLSTLLEVLKRIIQAAERNGS